MGKSSREFVTVDMRGLKVALVAAANAQRTSVSSLVRHAVERVLDLPAVGDKGHGEVPSGHGRGKGVKASIRFTAEESALIGDRARAAGLSRGAYLAGLASGVSILATPARRDDVIAALAASNAELSTLIRDLRHLAQLLRDGAIRAADEYRPRLETLVDDVRGHLGLAADALATLQPRARSTERPEQQRTGGRKEVYDG